jgi:hypothetical protein
MDTFEYTRMPRSFEARRLGLRPLVQRRLSKQQRSQFRAASIFVWDEFQTGIIRWTEGGSWSASRVTGCFLTHREKKAKWDSSMLLTSNDGQQHHAFFIPQLGPAPKWCAFLDNLVEEIADDLNNPSAFGNSRRVGEVSNN